MKRIIFLLLFIAFFTAEACTIGLAMPHATSDGRPLIFKTRDITSRILKFSTWNPSTGYSYAYNSYRNNETAWMGVNEVGLGIVQSAAYNLPSPGWGDSGLTNGSFMNFVLQYCETLDDVIHVLDSTNVTGRRTAANYAVIDAYGNGALFEVTLREYTRYDPDENGIITRGNFSYIGGSDRRGIERMERSHYLMTTAFEGDSLDARFIGMFVMADLERTGNDPYPLPFTGSFPGCPPGWVDCDSSHIETINNDKTMCASVIQGVAPGEDPALSVMFNYYACPAVSVPFVIFPASHTQPVAGHYIHGNPMSDTLRKLSFDRYDMAFHHSDPTLFDTQVLVHPDGGGIWDYVRPINEWVYDTVAIQIEAWLTSSPSAAMLAEFQDTVAERVLAAYSGEYAVGIDERYDRQYPDLFVIDAYPNPFNSAVSILLPQDISSAEIYDLSGKLVYSFAVEHGNRLLKWQPTGDISSGVYVINATCSKGFSTSNRIVYIR